MKPPRTIQLTVLTQPVSQFQYLRKRIIGQTSPFLQNIRNIVSHERIPFKTSQLDYGGHQAVTRSLIDGLRNTNCQFNYNPYSIKKVFSNVIVLSNVDALKQAIKLKKKGMICQLFAGPNLMVFSNEYNHVLTSPEIDKIIVPCEWVRVAYEEDEPLLKGKISIWFAGVDENFWKRDKYFPKNKNVVVYCKSESEIFWNEIIRILLNKGWLPQIIQYGHYSRDEYRKLLTNCEFAIFVSRSESQGIALAEAWSMDVPTFVWNPQELIYQQRKFSTVTSCPYLSKETGIEWKTISELDYFLDNFNSLLPSFHPREWLIKHMTDTIAAQNLIALFAKYYSGETKK